MATKTITTVILVLAVIFCIPIMIGVLGGIIGLIGGIFGAIVGIFAAIIGGIGGVFGWIFHGAFYWPFWHINFFTVAVIVLIVVLASRSRKKY